MVFCGGQTAGVMHGAWISALVLESVVIMQMQALHFFEEL